MSIPSSHPAIIYFLSGVRSQGQQLYQGSTYFPFPSQLFLGNPTVFPGQPGDVVSPASPGDLLPVGQAGRRPGGILSSCPNHLIHFDVADQRLNSEPLSDNQASHLMSKGGTRDHVEETHFCRLYPSSRSFGPDSQLMTIGEGRNGDPPVNRELRLSSFLTMTDRYRVCISAVAALICLSISCPHSWKRPWDSWIPPLVVRSHPYLGQSTPPFSMVSDLEVVIFRIWTKLS